MTPDNDPEPTPTGPIADFAAELHRRAESLLMDLPFALQPDAPEARDEQQTAFSFEDSDE